jgi:hypothetical protein
MRPQLMRAQERRGEENRVLAFFGHRVSLREESAAEEGMQSATELGFRARVSCRVSIS